MTFHPWENYIDEGQELLQGQQVSFSRPRQESDRLFMNIGGDDVIEMQHPAVPDDAPEHQRPGKPLIRSVPPRPIPLCCEQKWTLSKITECHAFRVVKQFWMHQSSSDLEKTVIGFSPWSWAVFMAALCCIMRIMMNFKHCTTLLQKAFFLLQQTQGPSQVLESP